MHRIHIIIILIAGWLILAFSCRNPTQNSSQEKVEKAPRTIVAQYHGILLTPGYDSIVNDLTLYANESFDLRQVDRLAEHHLNEKDHEGIYTYLADSSRIGLYSMDGYLMLQFLITEDGLTPMMLDSDELIDSSILWKKK